MSAADGESSGDDALRREVVALRAQVAELRRAAARHEDTAIVSLAEREELMREAERVAHFGTWTWDMESGRVTWSDELYRILALEPELVAPSFDAYFGAIHPTDRERVMAASERAIADGVLPLVDCRVVRPNGSIRHTTASAIYLFDAQGNPRRAVGAVLDRTRSLEVEAELRRALQLLEEAQRFAQLGSWRFEPQSGELEWSAEFRRIAGLGPEATPTVQAFMERVVPEDLPRFTAAYERVLRQPEELQLDGRLRRPHGEVRYVRLNGAALVGDSGQPELRGTMLDLTDQLRMREELAQAQKAEALGRLAGGIAHDFNNLLTVVMGNLDLLTDRVGPAPELDDCLGALASAAGLTKRLLAFGRKAQLSLKLIELNDLVRSTMTLMRRLVGDEVRLEAEFAADLPRVKVDALEVERALVNLVINARDAMPGGGVVNISTAVRRLEGVRQVELSVADRGPGVSDADRPHIFEPFYTTRRDAGGTGLGLATVLGTAEQHGGTVRVEARDGGGSIFTLVLPVPEAHEDNPAGSVEPGPVRSSAQALRLLVVDDEPMIADVTRRMLAARGHDVHVARGPEDALAYWAEHGPATDLVICDVVMAQMRGPELIERLASVGAPPRVLFITGYSDEAAKSQLGHPVLAKPFTAAALWRALGEVLGYQDDGKATAHGTGSG